MKSEKKQFYLAAIMLIVPMALQNLINVGVTSTDVIMLGKVGEEALSGASLGGQVYYIMNLFLFGLTSGVAVLTAQYWGKGDTRTIEKILGLALKISFIVGILFMTVTICFPEPIMRIYSSDPGVISEGVRYLRIVCFSYPLAALSMTYLYTLRSIEKAYVATIAYLISLIVNFIINLFLIFGLGGMPKMGVAGAAVGTLIARAVELFIAIYYDRIKNTIFKLHITSFKLDNKLILRDFIIISGPVILNELMWGIGSSMTTAILGQLGPSVSSANSVVFVVRQLAQVVSFGVAGAAAVMIGKRVGEGKMEQAKQEAKRFHWLSIIFGVLGCVVVIAISPIVVNFVSLTPESKIILSEMLIVNAIIVIAQSHNCTMIVGIYRGGGDTKMGMIIDGITMWGGSILLGFLSAFVFKFSIPVTFALLLSDEIIKIPFCLRYYYSNKWLRNITRELKAV